MSQSPQAERYVFSIGRAVFGVGMALLVTSCDSDPAFVVQSFSTATDLDQIVIRV